MNTAATTNTQVCLVSNQPIPNLTPLLDSSLEARRVILVVTPDMHERAGWLEDVLRPRGIRSELWPIDDAWDFDAIQSRIMELLERETEAGTRPALNATGGTKLMSIAAYEAFRAYDLPIFYVHPERDSIVWLQTGDSSGQPQELENRLRLEAFLQAHGARVAHKPRRNLPAAGDLELAETLIQGQDRYSRPIGTLNWLAASADHPGLDARLEHTTRELDELLDLFQQHGKLTRHGDSITFSDEKARFYANGGWIESHVYNQLRRLRGRRPRLQDLACALEVTRQQRDKTIPNELDVAFLHDNRLHIIECKTRRFRENGEESAGAEALYKLDTLRDLMGGLQARAMLISYRDLSGHDRSRAADLGIRVCAGSQLHHLRQHLLNFAAP
ncbi:MAG TPA: DUF1887 family protein [Gammaproteobacteria bacterium]|nr:DUF1887 family protein [Gammaproteobacteria bacterium]